jgi:hypothetical protein
VSGRWSVTTLVSKLVRYYKYFKANFVGNTIQPIGSPHLI